MRKVERQHAFAAGAHLVGAQRIGDRAPAASSCCCWARASRSGASARYPRCPAFDASRLVGASLRLNMQGYDRARILKFQDELRQRIAAMPGVTSVALATAMPLSNAVGWFPLAVDGASAPKESALHADYNVISPNFFNALGVRIAARPRSLPG